MSPNPPPKSLHDCARGPWKVQKRAGKMRKSRSNLDCQVRLQAKKIAFFASFADLFIHFLKFCFSPQTRFNPTPGGHVFQQALQGSLYARQEVWGWRGRPLRRTRSGVVWRQLVRSAGKVHGSTPTWSLYFLWYGRIAGGDVHVA